MLATVSDSRLESKLNNGSWPSLSILAVYLVWLKVVSTQLYYIIVGYFIMNLMLLTFHTIIPITMSSTFVHA